MNLEQLSKIYINAPKERLKRFLPYLLEAFDEFRIDTPLQKAMFLAQVGWESGQLRYVKELASGAAYEGRLDLGNTAPGDGVRYKGRGLIQITGKRNYVLVSLALNLPLLEKPELLEEDRNAVRSAGWFWYNERLGSLGDDIKKVTRRINGGYNHLKERTELYERAKKVLM